MIKTKLAYKYRVTEESWEQIAHDGMWEGDWELKKAPDGQLFEVSSEVLLDGQRVPCPDGPVYHVLERMGIAKDSPRLSIQETVREISFEEAARLCVLHFIPEELQAHVLRHL